MVDNPPPDADKQPPEIITTPLRASYIETIGTVRKMRSLLVHEYELESISWINTMVVVFFSMGSALLTYGIDIIIDAMGKSQSTAVELIMFRYGSPILILLAMVFFGLGVKSIFSRRNMLNRIRGETEVRKHNEE